VFGLPCLIYTVFGRFTFRKEPEYEGDFEEDEYDDLDEGESGQTKKCEQDAPSNGG
jgi:hypothetical protein